MEEDLIDGEAPETPILGAGLGLVSGLGGDAGFGEAFLGANDDGSTDQIDITSIFEDGLNFFGTVYDGLWINNNGSVTFSGPRSTFTPNAITSVSGNPEITPFFADVDTRGGEVDPTPGGNSTGSNLVWYAFDEASDRLVVTWDDVGYFSSKTDKLNAFQLLLTDRSEEGAPGDFDIQFRYETIDWTTGDFSGGTNGLGGTVARAGYTAGTGEEGAFFELPASGIEEAILALDAVPGNTGNIGQWVFAVRSGGIVTAEVPLLPEAGAFGWTVGDPHLSTLDGVGYSFQAVGEYVLVRDTLGAGLEVQARFVPAEDAEDVSVTAAVATRLTGGNVTIDGQGDAVVRLDGAALEVPNFSSVAVGGDRIYREDNTYTIVYAGADAVVGDGDSQLIVDVFDGRVDIDLRLTEDLGGNLEGLLGDGDGDPGNDVALADGTPLARPFVYTELYGQFRDDWRVSEAGDSLFSYAPGQGPRDFYDPIYPGRLITLDDIDPDLREAAELTAINAGLDPASANFDNAVLDFALTGDPTFILSSLGVPRLPEDAAVAVDPETVGPLLPTLEGDDGRDRLVGTAADELLLGEGARDILVGGGGEDVAIGGAGRDFFVIQAGDFLEIRDWKEGPDLLAVDDRILGLGDADIDIRALGVDEAFGLLAGGGVGYNRNTGLISVDLDGPDGPGGLTPVAQIEGGGPLLISDVFLF